MSTPSPSPRQLAREPRRAQRERIVDDELWRYVALLGWKLLERRLSIDELEDRLGWRPGTLEEWWQRPRSLRCDHLGELLEAIDVEPGAFYAELYGEGQPSSSGGGAGSLKRRPRPAPAAPSRDGRARARPRAAPR